MSPDLPSLRSRLSVADAMNYHRACSVNDIRAAMAVLNGRWRKRNLNYDQMRAHAANVRAYRDSDNPYEKTTDVMARTPQRYKPKPLPTCQRLTHVVIWCRGEPHTKHVEWREINSTHLRSIRLPTGVALELADTIDARLEASSAARTHARVAIVNTSNPRHKRVKWREVSSGKERSLVVTAGRARAYAARINARLEAELRAVATS